ncbi:hypothetical protein AVEN_130424-1 [Araneus ventricosus]|uniref:Uncharacterized protein n=1 Tax=Araneus ventricosus TaxID=182803 RepID=A0A4Y2N9W2_ARAVE|nr:hypothetical protein AVEN_130424-1 [Araneus ventricosus]
MYTPSLRHVYHHTKGISSLSGQSPSSILRLVPSGISSGHSPFCKNSPSPPLFQLCLRIGGEISASCLPTRMRSCRISKRFSLPVDNNDYLPS